MTAPPVDEHRTDLELLRSAAAADHAASWLEDDDPGVIRDALAALMPELASLYGSAAATLGADWYDDMRGLASAPGRFRAIPAELPDQGRLDALVGWGTQPLFVGTPEFDEGGEVVRIPKFGDSDFVPDLSAAKARVDGGFQRLVADMDRDTVRGSLTRDPQARGWSRQTTGKSCQFCVMLAGRGAVYSAKTADFSSHDNCDCIAVPVFGGDPRPVEPYTPSQRKRSSGNAKPAQPDTTRDVDADRSTAELRATLSSLERSLERFDSPGTRARVAELRRKIAART